MRVRFALTLCLVSSAAQAIGPDDLAITTEKPRPQSDYAAVLYTVKNNSPSRLEVSEVSCSVYDKAGALIGSGATVIRNIRPGETGTNRALLDVPASALRSLGAASCRIVDAR